MAKHILVTGVVHGVGFRPFVYGLATRLDLRGWVCNTPEGVEIYVQGSPSRIESFIKKIKTEKPSSVRIDSMDIRSGDVHDQYKTFDILPSLEQDDLDAPILSDIAICPDCERELFDPGNRRYLHPFINCAYCGPRYSVIKDIPYNRSNTTMAEFGMCEHCRTEYTDPLNRRFQAHTIACPECGPFVALREIHSQWPHASLKISSIECRTSAILKARRLLREGYILGIKGRGGYQLVCDASNSLTVEELRDRKGRVDRPFALMASNIEVARSICSLSRDEEMLLTSREKPIVLLEKKPQNGQDFNVSRWVAPNLDTLGVMLPYTALHHLLLNQTDLLLRTEPVPRLLVMTSGSLSDEPIATEDEDALLRLSPLADAFIIHNRDIHMRSDDSVVRVDPGLEDHHGRSSETVYVRRSRGYAPYTVKLAREIKPTLAVGSEFANAFCLTRDRHAFLSPYIGNMENVQTYESFEQSVRHLTRVFNVQPEIIAHDLHPDYFSSHYVRQSTLSARRVAVQHHHAHIASCMADNDLDDRQVIGLCFDGNGYGMDGAIWGGEVMLASYSDFERFAHLEYLPLPGGESASRTPWQIAVAYADALGLKIDDLAFLQRVERQELENLRRQMAEGSFLPLTSCLGSLLEAAASLMGVRNVTTYEAQVALEMEALARPFVPSVKSYPFVIETTEEETVVCLKDLFAAIIQDLRLGRSTGMMSARLHRTIAGIGVELCRQARRLANLNEVVLSGVAWQNQILVDLARSALKHDGFTVYTHCQVPANDSGLALGQAMVASYSSGVKEVVSPQGFVPVSRDGQPGMKKEPN